MTDPSGVPSLTKYYATEETYNGGMMIGVFKADGDSPKDGEVLVPLAEVAAELSALRGQLAEGCQCVCHEYPKHGKLQDALDALKWHQGQVEALRGQLTEAKRQRDTLVEALTGEAIQREQCSHRLCSLSESFEEESTAKLLRRILRAALTSQEPPASGG